MSSLNVQGTRARYNAHSLVSSVLILAMNTLFDNLMVKRGNIKDFIPFLQAYLSIAFECIELL